MMNDYAYNVDFTAVAVDNYLSNVALEETRIGELTSSTRNGKKDLVVYGHYIEDNAPPSWLMNRIGNSISVQEKFANINGMSTFKLLRDYYERQNKSKEELQKKLDIIQKINSNKLVIVPLKPGLACVVDGADSGNNQSIKIRAVEWYTDKEDSAVKSRIYLRSTGPCQKSFKFEITDYIDKFRLSGLEMNCSYTKADASIIKMTWSGMIRPIIFDDGVTKIAVDNTFVYNITDRGLFVIGKWIESTNDVKFIADIKSKAMKKFESCKTAISVHRKYIAPLYTIEANTVKLRGGK